MVVLKRKRAISARIAQPGFDNGARGMAMQARDVKIEPIATGSVSIGRERGERLRYTDEHLIDRMHAAAQLSNRQHESAHKLLEMFVAAGHAASRTCRYGAIPEWHNGGGDIDRPTARDVYRKFAKHYHGHQFSILEGMMQERHPGVRWLATAQEALERLADDWRIPRERG